MGLKLYTAVGLNVIYRNRNSVWTCASPKRDSDAFSDKRCPKIGGFALRAVPGSRCRDVIRMLKRWADRVAVLEVRERQAEAAID